MNCAPTWMEQIPRNLVLLLYLPWNLADVVDLEGNPVTINDGSYQRLVSLTWNDADDLH